MGNYVEKMKTASIPIRILAVMDHKRDDRIFKLEDYKTRCVKKHEMHELIIIDDETQNKGASYIGFIEILSSGVICEGMKININNKYIGEIIGFDYRHMPNHLNIIIKNSVKKTGIEMKLKPMDKGIIATE